MSGRILYRGVTASDSHPLHPGPESNKSRPPSEGGEDTESLDPRIQIELEKLNKASEDINRLELQLDDARARFRQVLTESTQMLNLQAKKLGTCIEKARPYYDARIKAKEAQTNTQNAALRYERSCGQLAAAKEMVYLAEEGFFNKGQKFDPAWQEMLNHATIKVNDAEHERYESEIEHQQKAMLFSEAEQYVKKLQKDLRRNIAKSRPYFEMKAGVNQQMEEQKKYVSQLESQVVTAKRLYGATLSNLERISDEIHHQRRKGRLRQDLGKRGVGVGAEAPTLVSEDPSTPSPIVSPIETPPHGEKSAWVDPLQQQSHPQSAEPAKPKSQSPDRSNVKSSHSRKNIEGEVKSETKPSRMTGEIVCMPRSLNADLSSDRSLLLGQPPSSCVPNPTSDTTATPSLAKSPTSAGTKVVLRRKKSSTSEAATPTSRPFHRFVSSPPPSSRSRGSVPVVQVTAPCFSAPTSPTMPDALSEAGQDLDDRNVQTNAELMESLRKQKSKAFGAGLRPNRHSHDDLLDMLSDTESLTGSVASASMLDDEQIESLMLEMGEYTRFLEQLDDKQAIKWKRLSLPAKLTQVEKNFNLQEFLSEIRMPEEADEEEEVFTEDSIPPPIAEEEDISMGSMETDSRTYGTCDPNTEGMTDPNVSDDETFPPDQHDQSKAIPRD